MTSVLVVTGGHPFEADPFFAIFDGLELDGIAAASPSIPRKLGTPSPELPIKDTLLNKKLRVRAKLANLGWDRTAESLHLPTLTENGKWIYRCTD